VDPIMLVENSKYFTLQYMLFKLQSEISMLNQMQNVSSANASQLPSESLKMATAFATAAPILLLYPFLQKHFVQGLVMGAVKG
jgi:putative aldouronate transport system permease protein